MLYQVNKWNVEFHKKFMNFKYIHKLDIWYYYNHVKNGYRKMGEMCPNVNSCYFYMVELWVNYFLLIYLFIIFLIFHNELILNACAHTQ